MSILLALTAASLASSAPAFPDPAPVLSFSDGDASALSHRRIVPRDPPRPMRRRGGGGIVYYDRDYQGDSVWRSNSFNDWWHDNPERAYPRWMQNNGNCDRQWYAGDTLRC